MNNPFLANITYRDGTTDSFAFSSQAQGNDRVLILVNIANEVLMVPFDTIRQVRFKESALANLIVPAGGGH